MRLVEIEKPWPAEEEGGILETFISPILYIDFRQRWETATIRSRSIIKRKQMAEWILAKAPSKPLDG